MTMEKYWPRNLDQADQNSLVVKCHHATQGKLTFYIMEMSFLFS